MRNVTMSSPVLVASGWFNVRQKAAQALNCIPKSKHHIVLTMLAIASTPFLSAATPSECTPNSTRDRVAAPVSSIWKSTGAPFILAQNQGRPAL